MPLFRYANLRFYAPRAIARQIRPLIAKLVADDFDGSAYRCAVRHWLYFDRPIIEGFAGRLMVLHIEGPVVDIGLQRFPMGSVLSGEEGSRRLDPIQTNQLVAEVREAIDATVSHWLSSNTTTESPTGPCTELDRDVDDSQAIDAMLAWVLRGNQIETLSAARG